MPPSDAGCFVTPKMESHLLRMKFEASEVLARVDGRGDPYPRIWFFRQPWPRRQVELLRDLPTKVLLERFRESPPGPSSDLTMPVER